MLSRVQQLLLDALLSDDPPRTLRRLAEQAADLSETERAFLRRIDADGFRLSALLIQKLRFERLTAADPALAEQFERRPEEVVALFRAYNAAVPPIVYFPEQEAGRYHQWRDQADREPA
jgi:hypothetical protein